MESDRLALFTDAVLAIVITIMVLELPLPEGTNWPALRTVLPLFGLYALTFVHLMNSWRYHHQALRRRPLISDRVIWANGFLLFWFSLIPFVIRWIGEKGIGAWPVAAYGACQSMTLIAWVIFKRSLRAANPGLFPPPTSGNVWRELLTIALFAVAIPAAFLEPYFSLALYAFILIVWTVPDRRFEDQGSGQAPAES